MSSIRIHSFTHLFIFLSPLSSNLSPHISRFSFFFVQYVHLIRSFFFFELLFFPQKPIYLNLTCLSLWDFFLLVSLNRRFFVSGGWFESTNKIISNIFTCKLPLDLHLHNPNPLLSSLLRSALFLPPSHPSIHSPAYSTIFSHISHLTSTKH